MDGTSDRLEVDDRTDGPRYRWQLQLTDQSNMDGGTQTKIELKTATN